MVSVLHLRKELTHPPVASVVEGLSVRTIDVPADVPAWLALRDHAMAGQRPPVRAWSQHDYTNEMLNKPWWRSDRTWVAIARDKTSATVVGAVTLALRQGAVNTVPIIHWLLVDPAWRRRGVGRLLVSHLERAAWEAGWREVELETHAGWSAAVAFYQSMGYAPVRGRSPR